MSSYIRIKDIFWQGIRVRRDPNPNPTRTRPEPEAKSPNPTRKNEGKPDPNQKWVNVYHFSIFGNEKEIGIW